MESVGSDQEFEARRIGVLPPDLVSKHSGLEVLQRLANGELPPPAMSEIIPFWLMEVAAGRVVLRAPLMSDLTIPPELSTADMR